MFECRYYINNVAKSKPGIPCSESLLFGKNAVLGFGRYFWMDLNCMPFIGKVYLLAVYSPKLNASDVSNLFIRGLPNQPPSAISSQITIPEFGHLEDPNSNQSISAFDVVLGPNIRYVPKQDWHGSVSFEFFVIEAQGFIKSHFYCLSLTHHSNTHSVSLITQKCRRQQEKVENGKCID